MFLVIALMGFVGVFGYCFPKHLVFVVMFSWALLVFLVVFSWALLVFLVMFS